MRVTIIPADRVVGIDGAFRGPLDFSLADEIHAVQWFGAAGEVEYRPTLLEGRMVKPPNATITDLAPFQAALDAWAAAAPPPPPPPPPPPVSTLSRSQFFRVLARSGIITPEEAVASAQTSTMPAAIAAILVGLTAEEQVDARILWATAVVFERSNPLFGAAVAADLATEAEIDGLFALGATLP